MTFKSTKRHGVYWETLKKLHGDLDRINFCTSGCKELDFERSISSVIDSNRANYKLSFISQYIKDTTVKPVFCFGKSHRPDMSFEEDGIAIEVKYIRVFPRTGVYL